MKKWVLVGTVLMFLVTLTTGNSVQQQAEAMPPTPATIDVQQS
ncbi:hypothetical protein [Tumebacillus algifaecis]|nr:hypothetical protein [Tumebacillus algifaecis]